MTCQATLASHVVFRELPFCGVLVDIRSARVYRLSRRASGTLRAALERPAAATDNRWVRGLDGSAAHDESTGRLLRALAARGLVHPVGPDALRTRTASRGSER